MRDCVKRVEQLIGQGAKIDLEVKKWEHIRPVMFRCSAKIGGKEINYYYSPSLEQAREDAAKSICDILDAINHSNFDWTL